MTLLPSQFERPDTRVELLFGETWVDVTGRLLSDSFTITRGRDDESAEPQPAGVQFELDNNDGHLTPDNPVSPYWPHVRRRDVECRVRMPEFEVSGRGLLNLDGGTDTAQTPDDPALDITGDIDLRWWGAGDFSGSPVLASKWQTEPDERAWVLWVDSGRHLNFWWRHAAGVAAVAPLAAPSPAAFLPLPIGATDLAIRCTVEIETVSNDAVGTWYTAPSIAGPWAQFGFPLTLPSEDPLDILATTARLQVGNIDNLPTEASRPFIGQVRAFDLRDGIDGTVVADPDFRALARGTTAFSDDAGRSWTLEGDAHITEPARFWGQVVDWSPTWPHGDQSGPASGGDARVSITASGVLRRLSQGQKPLQSTLRRFIQNEDRVIAYWPMEDGRDSDTLASPIPGVSPMTFGGAITLASDDSLVASAPLPTIGANQGGGWNAEVPQHPDPTSWRFDMFLRQEALNTSTPGTLLAQIYSTGSVQLWRIYTGAGAIRFRGWIDTTEGAHTFEHDAVLDDDFFAEGGRISMLVFHDGSGVSYSPVWIKIDGSAIGGTNALLATEVGRVTRLGALSAAGPEGLTVAHVAITRNTPVSWLASAGSVTGGPDTAYKGEGATARIARLCAEEGIPLQARGNSNIAMGPQGQDTFLTLIKDAGAADLGVLSERLDRPGLVYRARETLYNQPAALELDAGRDADPWRPGDIDHPFEPKLDDQDIRNDVTATREDGSSFRATDEESITDGRYDTDVTLNLARDSQLSGQAGWRLHLGTWKGMRYPSLSIPLDIAQDHIPNWVTAELGDRVTVTGLPPQHPTDTVDLLDQRISETLHPDRWTVELTCTPAGPWDVGVLDDSPPDTEMRRLDSRGSALADPINETATAFDVAFPGYRWVTTAGEGDQFPFKITIGGERMTVTGISGTSSPQTFTVVRSVNEVVKPHPAGAAVQVADPLRLAL